MKEPPAMVTSMALSYYKPKPHLTTTCGCLRYPVASQAVLDPYSHNYNYRNLSPASQTYGQDLSYLKDTRLCRTASKRLTGGAEIFCINRGTMIDRTATATNFRLSLTLLTTV